MGSPDYRSAERHLEAEMPAPPPPKRHPYNQWSPDARALDLVGDKWTLLIIRDLASGPRRFVELQRVLPGISTEQLRSRLNRMVADGLLTRQRYREVPPRVDYELTDRSKELLPVVGELARWGYQWAWGPPRPDEAIDVGAVFRCAPGMVQVPDGTAGSIELSVGQRQYTLVCEHGGVRIEERPAPEARARVSGTERAWIEALGPASSRVDLDLEGDRALANLVLDGFSAVASRRAVRAA
jgi:DNA-binding HxlR family transcriptional regulator